MFKFIFTYNDDSVKVKYFPTKIAGIMWAHNEGDHLWNYAYEEVNPSSAQSEDIKKDL